MLKRQRRGRQVNGVCLRISFEAKIWSWIPINPATGTRNPENKFYCSEKPGVIVHKKYEISTHSGHTMFSIPLDSASIRTVYWHVTWHRRNPAATVKFRVHTHLPQTLQYTPCFIQYTWCILTPLMTYKESCHKCIRSWYFSWPTLKYTDH